MFVLLSGDQSVVEVIRCPVHCRSPASALPSLRKLRSLGPRRATRVQLLRGITTNVLPGARDLFFPAEASTQTFDNGAAGGHAPEL